MLDTRRVVEIFLEVSEEYCGSGNYKMRWLLSGTERHAKHEGPRDGRERQGRATARPWLSQLPSHLLLGS
jgi:hypothetical protein